MDDREFEQRLDELFNKIEDIVDELELDIDASAGLLTIEFANGSSVILSRQVSNHELWVAARSGGFHLAFQADSWVCHTSSESLAALLNRVFTEQMGEPVNRFEGIV